MRFIVIGSGKTAIGVSKAIASYEGAQLVGMVGDSRQETAQSSFMKQAAKLGVDAIAVKSLKDDPALSFLKAANPDYIISANNFMIFGEEALAIAKKSTVNFHNGPLPRYGGVSPFCWALMRGEGSYGITWHVVDLGIDTGDILVQVPFDIEHEDTALTMMIRCIDLAISSFKADVLPMLMTGALNPYKKLGVEHEYFSAKDVPYEGLLPWWLSGDELDRYVRAMTFAPLPNLFYRPCLETKNGHKVHGGRIELGESQTDAAPGTVIAKDDKFITIATSDRSLIVSEFYKSRSPKFQTRVEHPEIIVGDTLLQPNFRKNDMNKLAELEAIFREVFDEDDITLTAETTADDVDGWDSLTHVNLILTVERHFGVRFDTTEISNMKNVGELADLIALKTA